MHIHITLPLQPKKKKGRPAITTYRLIRFLNSLDNNRRLGILRQRDIIVVLNLDILLVQHTIDLAHIVDEGQLVPELVLVRVDDPICEQVLQRRNV